MEDDKRFLNIRIDVHHPFPMVSTCRIRKKDGSLYFGPYINGRAAVAVDFGSGCSIKTLSVRAG